MTRGPLGERGPAVAGGAAAPAAPPSAAVLAVDTAAAPKQCETTGGMHGVLV